MIKIINGVFGYNDGMSVIPKTPKDGPFECAKEIEERLIEQGVAIRVDAEETPAPQSHDDLVKQAKELGIGGNVAGMKDETLIKKINEALEKQKADGEDETADDEPNADADGETDADEENAPDLGQDDGVVE